MGDQSSAGRSVRAAGQQARQARGGRLERAAANLRRTLNQRGLSVQQIRRNLPNRLVRR